MAGGDSRHLKERGKHYNPFLHLTQPYYQKIRTIYSLHTYAILCYNYAKQEIKIMSLILHCGAKRVEKQDVLDCPAPDGTPTHQPIEHSYLIEETEKLIKENDLLIKDEAFALSNGGMRMFGMYKLDSPFDGYSATVGIRNSNDKRFAAGAVIGTNTTVCDNLMFHGEYKMQRKHTKYIYDYLSELMGSFVGNIPMFQNIREREINKLKATKISNDRANRFIIECVKRKVVPPSQVLQVVKEWEKPGSTVNKDYSVFNEHGDSLWKMQNAFTTVLHNNKNVFGLPEKTINLNKMLSSYRSESSTVQI